MMNEDENEFLRYMEDKVATAPSNSFEQEMNEVLLSLYGKGFLNVVMEDGEPMISISDSGHEAFLAEYALTTMSPIEA